ncbi:cell division protein ZapD, partial [Neisseria dentiae]
MIRFEHPLSERVRSFLRIEHLFNRFQTESMQQEDSPWPHHLALFTLFEIMECAGRAELKLDILQELERQRQFAAAGRIQGAQAVLSAQLQAVAENLQGIKQKFGQHLRENDWLMAIKQRMLVAGGTSPFDLPAYYFWQRQP